MDLIKRIQKFLKKNIYIGKKIYTLPLILVNKIK